MVRAVVRGGVAMFPDLSAYPDAKGDDLGIVGPHEGGAVLIEPRPAPSGIVTRRPLVIDGVQVAPRRTTVDDDRIRELVAAGHTAALVAALPESFDPRDYGAHDPREDTPAPPTPEPFEPREPRPDVDYERKTKRQIIEENPGAGLDMKMTKAAMIEALS